MLSPWRQRFFLLCAGLLLILPAAGWQDNYATGARNHAMGNASVTHRDVFSNYSNQAGLTGIKSVTAGIYSERRLMSEALHVGSIALAMPINNGAFGLSATYFGYHNFNDKKIGLAYAHRLTEHFSAAVQFDYLSTFVQETGTRHMFTFEAGILAQLLPELTLGVHIFNPVRTRMARYMDERVPAIFRFGLGYTPSDKLVLNAEVAKDIEHKPRFKAGVEYHITNPLYLRAGILTNPVINTFGIGLVRNALQVDLAASIHPMLGLTPHLSLTYAFATK